jgi:hypothetical protein
MCAKIFLHSLYSLEGMAKGKEKEKRQQCRSEKKKRKQLFLFNKSKFFFSGMSVVVVIRETIVGVCNCKLNDILQ